jgi:NAD-dependent dihydropyrimidine dehydrogenase PreA subunit
MKACAVSCIGCGKCEKECNFGAITVENNLAYIDFEKCRLCRKCVTACPKKTILDVNFPTPAPAPKPKEPAAPKPAPEEKPSESPKAAPAEKPKEAPKPVEKPKAPVEQKPVVKEPSRGAFLDTDSSISIK